MFHCSTIPVIGIDGKIAQHDAEQSRHLFYGIRHIQRPKRRNAGIDANAISPDKAVADGVDNKDSQTAQMNSILSQRTSLAAQLQTT